VEHKVPVGLEIAIVKRAMYLAYTMSYNVLDKVSKVVLTEDEIFDAATQDVQREKKGDRIDTPIEPLTPQDLEGERLFVDFTNGRQVKLHISYSGPGIVSTPDFIPIVRDQTWAHQYETFGHLIQIATEQVVEQAKREEFNAKKEQEEKDKKDKLAALAAQGNGSSGAGTGTSK
jgi:hypothetical protein